MSSEIWSTNHKLNTPPCSADIFWTLKSVFDWVSHNLPKGNNEKLSDAKKKGKKKKKKKGQEHKGKEHKLKTFIEKYYFVLCWQISSYFDNSVGWKWLMDSNDFSRQSQSQEACILWNAGQRVTKCVWINLLSK